MMRPQCSHVKQFGICLIRINIDSGYFGYLVKFLMSADIKRASTK